MPAEDERREPVTEEAKDEENKQPAEQHAEPADEPAKEGSENAEDVEKKEVEEGEEGEEGSPKKKDKYARGGKHPIIGLIIFVALQFIALLFVVVATPIELFKIDTKWRDLLFPALTGSSKKLCVTAWGLKLGCRSKAYYYRDFTTIFCYRVRTDFKIIEAFCIMVSCFQLLALVAGICSIFQKCSKVSVGVLASFSMVLVIIPWGILCGMFFQVPCCETSNWYLPNQTTVCHFIDTSPLANLNVPPFKDMGTYGAGFGLLVAAWCLQLIACVFAFVPL